MAKEIHIIDDDGNLIKPEKAAVFLFGETDEESDTCDVSVEMVGMSGQDLYLLVSTAINLGDRLGMFGGAYDA